MQREGEMRDKQDSERKQEWRESANVVEKKERPTDRQIHRATDKWTDKEYNNRRYESKRTIKKMKTKRGGEVKR